MRQIALAAEVSRSTVSRALSNDPQIPCETRDRVGRIARELGYQRDPAYDILAAKRWQNNEHAPRFNLVFLVLNHLNEAVWRGAVRRAAELGYHLEPMDAKDPAKAAALDRILYARGVRGILLPPVIREGGLPDLRWERYAVVCTGVDLVRPPFHTVRPNVVSKIDRAWREAVARGYQRIGTALPTETDNELDRRRMGIALYHQQHVPKARRVPVWEGRFRDRKGFMKWFEKHKPDCVIAGTDSLREWLREIGARVPAECGFVSLFPAATRHGGEDLARLASRNERIGEVALSLLDQQIKQHETGIPDDPFTVVIEPGWHEGKTLPWKQSAAG